MAWSIMGVARCCLLLFFRNIQHSRAARNYHIFCLHYVPKLTLSCHVEGTICPISFVKETLVGSSLFLLLTLLPFPICLQVEISVKDKKD